MGFNFGTNSPPKAKPADRHYECKAIHHPCSIFHIIDKQIPVFYVHDVICILCNLTLLNTGALSAAHCSDARFIHPNS